MNNFGGNFAIFKIFLLKKSSFISIDCIKKKKIADWKKEKIAVLLKCKAYQHGPKCVLQSHCLSMNVFVYICVSVRVSVCQCMRNVKVSRPLSLSLFIHHYATKNIIPS